MPPGPPPASPLTLEEALGRLGHPHADPPRAPVVERDGATVVLLAVLGSGGSAVWSGLWLGPEGLRAVGPVASRSELGSSLAEPARSLVDLAVAASVSYAARAEELGRELDRTEGLADPPEPTALSGLQRGLLQVHRHQARLARLLTELSGPVGTRFPGVEKVAARLSSDAMRTADSLAALLQAVRDLAVLRTAVEANRLAASANELGRASNEIAALANNSNIRMLGVAYVALAIALVSVVVLIPNTAATILGMPSAAWVPGIWVDAILVVLAIVPIAFVFSRPWVRRMLASSREYEARSSEGLADLPELSPANAARPGEAERLIRNRP